MTSSLKPQERKSYERSKTILVDALLRKESVGEIIRKAAEIFDSPIVLTTSSYRVLALENRGYEVDDPVWRMAEKTGYCGADSVALFEAEGVTRQVLASEGAFVLREGLAGRIPRILQKISVFGRVGAYIGIFQMNRAFSAADLSLCDLLCRVLSVTMERDPLILSHCHTIRESILTDLLSGNIATAALLNDRMRSASWKLKSYYDCILVTPEYACAGIDNADYIKELLQREIPHSQATQVPEGLLLIAGFDEEPLFPRYLKKLTQIAERYGFYMNVSKSFPDLIRAKEYYALCVRMHHTAKKHRLESRLTLFKDIIYMMLTEQMNKSEQLTFAQPGYRLLSAYDKEHGTDYCRTLQIYIECGCNITQAAAALFVHRNTFARRLGRIAEIAGIDTGDGRTLIHFYLTAEMMKAAGDNQR